MLRGKDSAALHQLFRDSLQELYNRLFDIDADALVVPEDYYSAIAEASELAGDRRSMELDPQVLLYLMEFYKIVKIGGINSPFACMEWPGIKIPQTILSLMDSKGIVYHFIDDKGAWEESTLLFSERNLEGRGLDFDDTPEDKPNFVRYALEFRCLNPLNDTKKSPLPPLEELADEAVTTITAVGLQPNKEHKKELEKALQTTGSLRDWLPLAKGPCNRDARINTHLGVGGAMTPGRIQDPEGAKIMVIFFKTTPGAILAIQRPTYKIVCFKDTISGRLKVDLDATAGGKQNPALQGSWVILIYKTYMHTESTLDPERCAYKSDPGMRIKWII
jgi:hypothetical protein